jgi:hypothetical protein
MFQVFIKEMKGNKNIGNAFVKVDNVISGADRMETERSVW